MAKRAIVIPYFSTQIMSQNEAPHPHRVTMTVYVEKFYHEDVTRS